MVICLVRRNSRTSLQTRLHSSYNACTHVLALVVLNQIRKGALGLLRLVSEALVCLYLRIWLDICAHSSSSSWVWSWRFYTFSPRLNRSAIPSSLASFVFSSAVSFVRCGLALSNRSLSNFWKSSLGLLWLSNNSLTFTIYLFLFIRFLPRPVFKALDMTFLSALSTTPITLLIGCSGRPKKEVTWKYSSPSGEISEK